MNLFDTKFMKLFFYKEQNLLEVIRLYGEDLSEEHYRSLSLKIGDEVEANHVTKILMNNSNFRFVIVPSLQEWSNEHVVQRFTKAGIQKIAYIVNEDIFTQISLQQLYEDDKDQIIKVKYFESNKQAKEWLDID